MDNSRDDFGIAIRSAFLRKGAQQKFSLLALFILSIFLLFFDKIELQGINSFRSIFKDLIYRGSFLTSIPSKTFSRIHINIEDHINLYDNFKILKNENKKLKQKKIMSDFLILENTQLRKIVDEKATFTSNYISARVMLDKKSPYLNSFIINIGSNKEIKKGMAVLDNQDFIGRVVDVNYFSSRVLLISDLNSKIPVIIGPSGYHAILSGKGKNYPTLDYLPKENTIKEGDKIFTSGKEGIFSPGIPIGVIKKTKDQYTAFLYSDLNQITFVNIKLDKEK